MNEIPELVREALVAELGRQERLIADGCCANQTHWLRAEAIRDYLAEAAGVMDETIRDAARELMATVLRYGDARQHLGELRAQDAPAAAIREADGQANGVLTEILREVEARFAAE